MKSWSVQNAKARFSELLETCLREGPQLVTRRGSEAAVLVSIQEWHRLARAAKPTLKELLLSDFARAELVIPRRGTRRRRKALPARWLGTVDDSDLHISAVTLGEIHAGIEITREQDPAKATEIELWADQLAATWNVLPMDARAFRAWAKLMHRRSDVLIEDAMIAATAGLHRLKIVTRNVRDFNAFGIEVLNPFSFARK